MPLVPIVSALLAGMVLAMLFCSTRRVYWARFAFLRTGRSKKLFSGLPAGRQMASPSPTLLAWVAFGRSLTQIDNQIPLQIPLQITHLEQNCSRPFWSPDGGTIYFIVGGAKSRNDVMAVPAIGGKAVAVLHGARRATLHPDGKTFAFCVLASFGSARPIRRMPWNTVGV